MDTFARVAATTLLLSFSFSALLLADESSPGRNRKIDDYDRAGEHRSDDADRCDGDEREGARPRLRVVYPGVQSDIWSDGSLSLGIPLGNEGTASAADVKVRQIEIDDSTRVEPANLPSEVGEILPDDAQQVDARFIFPHHVTDRTLRLVLSGSYRFHGHRCDFRTRTTFVPKALPAGPFVATPGQMIKWTARTALFPPLPPPQTEDFNEFGFFIVPHGQPRNLFRIAPPASPLQVLRPQKLPNFPQPVFMNDAGTFAIAENAIGSSTGGFPPDPSVAGADASDVVLMSYNTAVDVSTDGGLTFHQVPLAGGAFSDPANPNRTSLFPEDDGGLCCDQVLNYVPARGIYVWLLQYWPKSGAGPNRLRIAWATPADIKSNFLYAWTWVDLTSDVLGLGIEGVDYPDLAFSDNFVYVGVDNVINQQNNPNNGRVYNNRHIFSRLSLDDIVNTSSSTVGLSTVNPTYNGLIQNHIVQSSSDTMYFGAIPNNSSLSLFTWPDNSNQISVQNIPVSSFNPGAGSYVAIAPDGPNWNSAPANILGATRVDPFVLCQQPGCDSPHYIYMAFTAESNGSSRPYPYVRVEKFDAGAGSRVDEIDIWNPGFAFATPALGSNPTLGRDEVALSIALGGGGKFADNAVGFLGDYVVYTTTDSDTTQAVYARDAQNNIIRDSNGNPTFATRFGDYYSVRNSIGPPTANGRGTGYSTAAYAVKSQISGLPCYQAGCSAFMHYILFGRPGDLYPQPPPR